MNTNTSSSIITKPLDIYRVVVVGEECTYTTTGFQSREDAIKLAEKLSAYHSEVEVRQPVEFYYQLSKSQVFDRQEYRVIYSSCTISLD